jgi:hypothetical protein
VIKKSYSWVNVFWQGYKTINLNKHDIF